MKGDELDRILACALASYSLQEPRSGLSSRVMARVRTEGAASRAGWFLLAVVAAALACVAIAIVTWRSETRPPQVALLAPVADKNVEQPPNLPRRDFARRVEHRQPARRLPRRESFPSPSPLTPEERTLVAFAEQAPEAAQRFGQPEKPLEIEPIDIRPLQIDGLQTGESK